MWCQHTQGNVVPRHTTLCTSEQQVCIVFFAGPAISYVVAGSQPIDQPFRRIQDRLELTDQVSQKADQHAVSIVQLGIGMYQCDHQHLKSGRQYNTTDLT